MRLHVVTIMVFLILGPWIQGCSESPVPTGPQASDGTVLPGGITAAPGLTSEIAICGEARTVTLIAGRGTPVGEVTVANDGATLWIEIRTTDGWVMHRTQAKIVSVGGAPVGVPAGLTRAGGLRLMALHKPPVEQHVHEFDLAAARLAPGETLMVTVQALVSNVLAVRPGRARLSAWARDLLAPSRPGKSSFEYVVQACDSPPGCELVFLWPLGGETLCIENTYLVLWEPVEVCGDSVSIELLFAGEPCQTLRAAAPNDGEFEWEAVAPCAGEPEGYSLRITDLECGCQAETAQPFTIDDCGTGE